MEVCGTDRLPIGLTSAGAGEQEAKNITTEIVSAPSSMDQLNVYSTYSSSYPVETLHEESLIAGFRANTAVCLVGTNVDIEMAIDKRTSVRYVQILSPPIVPLNMTEEPHEKR